MSLIHRTEEFPLKEARAMVKDLMTPKPHIYWVDFLLSVGLGWAMFYVALMSDFNQVWAYGATLISALALYRAVIFIHEIVHFKKGTLLSFKAAWNVLCGFAMLVPAFTYQGVHIDHHKRDIYGTLEDGEYLPFGAQNPLLNVWYVVSSIFLPALIIGRFVILSPLGWLIPPLGRFIWQRSSSLTIDLTYRRPPPTVLDGKYWRLQEVMAWLYGVAAVVALYFGIIPMKAFYLWYAIMVLILTLNSLRTLGAHAYRNPGHEVLSVPEQFLDSVDVPYGFITPLWAPVGLRFHATHHLFPNMPYHSLGEAYERLSRDLPQKHLYLAATRKSLWHALSTLWSDAKKYQSMKE